jgi:hypothetical protein
MRQLHLPFVKIICFCHRLADQRRFSENLLLALIRLEGFALLDPERPEHGHHDAVALLHRFFVDPA